ncbi:MAG: carboxypeptidase-like regulatory domain-containing protein, partial [Acidobacteriota bacterium]
MPLKSFAPVAIGAVLSALVFPPPIAAAEESAEALRSQLLTLDRELHDVINGADAVGQSGLDIERLERLEQRIRGFAAQCRADCTGDLVAKGHRLLSAVLDLKIGFSPWDPPDFPTTKAAARCDDAPAVEPAASVIGRDGEVTWVRFTVPADGRYRVTTAGSRGDSALSVFRECGGAAVAEVDDSIGLAATATVSAAAGETLFVALRGVGGDPIGRIVAEEDLGGASLGGTVRETDGTPMPGVRVILYELGSFSSRSLDSGLDGGYLFTGLDPGNYVAVSSTFDGPFLNVAWQDVICEAFCDPLDVGTPISVQAGSTVQGIDLRLPRGGEITGRVRQSGTAVIPTSAASILYRADGTPLDGEFVDGSGRYRHRRLAPGTYFVSAEAPGFRSEIWRDQPCPDSGQCNPLDGEPINIELAELRDSVDFSLDRLGAIEVDVTDAQTGEPVFSVALELFDAAGDFVTSSNFSNQLSGVPGGLYFLTVSANGYQRELYNDIPCAATCNVTDGTAFTVVEGETNRLSVALDPEGSISGFVRDAEVGDVLFSRVEAFDLDGNFVTGDFASSFDGSYLLRDLPTGQYRVVASSSDYQDEAWEETPCSVDCNLAGDLIAVASGQDVESIDFTLTPLGTITGRVTDILNGDGLPFPDVRVFDAAGQVASFPATQIDGTFRTGPLEPGTYYVTEDDGARYLGEVWDDVLCDGSCDPLTGTPIALSLAEERVADFALATAPFIRGSVREAGSGELIEDARVEIFDASGERVDTIFTSDGTFELFGIDEGIYYAEASGNSVHVEMLWENVVCPGGAPFGCSVLDGDPIVVDAAGVTVDFFLPLGAVISGSVAATGGPPSPTGSVRIFDGAGLQVGTGFITGSGEWRAVGLGAGTYFAAADPNLHTNRLWNGLPCGDAGILACDPTLGTPITVTLGEERTDVDFVVDRLGQIEGRVFSSSGTSDFGRVWLYDAGGEAVASRSVSLPPFGGFFSFDGLEPGIYYLGTQLFARHYDQILGGEACEPDPCDPTSGTELDVRLSAALEPIELILDPGPGARIQLRSDIGSPIIDAAVDLWALDGTLLE